jgi:hypothetical protein
MKKQQIIIGLAVILLLVLVYFMGRDLFNNNPADQTNPTEYNIDKYRVVDSSRLCYREIRQIPLSLEEAAGLTVDVYNNVYVAGDKKVMVFDAGWNHKTDFKIDSLAQCIAAGTKNSLFIGVGAHVEEFGINGKPVHNWKAYNEDGYITSIVQIGDYIYAADAANKLVLKYNEAGQLQGEIGLRDTARGIDGFVIPSMYFDVAKGPGEDLWVTNPGRHQLQNFSEQGKLNTSWGEASMQLEGFAGCCNPIHFAILPDGCFVTCEKGLDRIKIYNQAGIFVCVVSAPTSIDEAALSNCSIGARVHDIAVDSSGNILVLDASSKLIRVYQALSLKTAKN